MDTDDHGCLMLVVSHEALAVGSCANLGWTWINTDCWVCFWTTNYSKDTKRVRVFRGGQSSTWAAFREL